MFHAPGKETGTQSNVAADACNRIVHSKEQDDAETEPLDFFRDDSPTDSLPQSTANLKGTTDEKDQEEEEEEILLDPLGLMKAKKPKKPVVVQAEPPKPKPRAKPALFDEEVDPDEDLFGAAKDFVPTNTKKTAYGKNDLKLFEDQDLGGTVKLGDSLLLPTACQTKDQAFKSVLDDDTEDLFRVEDDFEKLMKLGSKPAVKPKPKVPTKPPLPKKPTIAAGKVQGPAPPAKPPDHNVQTMDQIDILKYIQDNESSNQDSLNLF